MIKTFENRTLGLQTKLIENKQTAVACRFCGGTGYTKYQIPGGLFKNVKLGAIIDVHDECEHCNGSGNKISTLRVIKRG